MKGERGVVRKEGMRARASAELCISRFIYACGWGERPLKQIAELIEHVNSRSSKTSRDILGAARESVHEKGARCL